MFILRSVVGKLWLTIIGLVGVVLLILGFFLVNYLENYFSQAKDQQESLRAMASKFSAEATQHMYNEQFYELSNELLSFQDARLLVVNLEGKEMIIPDTPGSTLIDFHVSDFFTQAELQEVYSGKTLKKTVNSATKRFGSGTEYLVVAVPLYNLQGVPAGATLVYQSLQSLEATQNYMLKLFVYVSIVGFLMTTSFAFFLFSRITRPLQQLKKAADFITMGEYGTRVPITSKDEIGELAKTFNHMGEKMQDSINALSEEKEHLSSILRSMTDAVITVDSNGSVMLSNPQGEKIVEEWSVIEWDDADGEPPRYPKPDPSLGDWGLTSYRNPYLTPIPVPLIPLFEAVVESSSECATKLHVQNSVWSVAMTPLYSSQDHVRGAVAVLRNVTEEERLDKLRKDFVANVSHELRTPISMLQGYSEALLDDIPTTPEERVELVQVIHDESLRMGRLVGDLLDLARMEAGQIELSLREVELDSLMRRMHRKFSVLAKDRGILLSAELPEEPLILQRADEDRLEQVFTNLLDNAFRHTAAGARIALTAQSAVYKDRPSIRVDISDEGKGIPADDLPYIFERFYKADKARTRGTTGGTGLGLAIVKNIIDAHNGSVTVHSVLGQGTTFTIYLPSEAG
ncbi:sensor histidine kinase [Paenibacillus whitsoniae]|uniref:histidine kinase n=1 Tax=Paenibacillus whitsoniae TaxID=2496558 RepID=A0A430JHL2_9BACL|nr:ATP-binding protein [Paenibacillus whitsoniae]RTE10495.1 HAMP domain-containing protein [Paenibacillus whitsoniae]